MTNIQKLQHWLIEHWDIPADATLSPVTSGLINDTYAIQSGEVRHGIFQRLNTSIFQVSVLEDMSAISRHLRERGVGATELVATRDGATYRQLDDQVWRVLAHVGSQTFERVPSPAHAASAGHLIARFHGALQDCDWSFQHVRPGAHDTPAHMQFLASTLQTHRAHRLYDEVAKIAEYLFESWERLQRDLPAELPTRIIHGDLKISNIRFHRDQAVALIDLDTLAHGTLDVELGDAMRSWCATADEDATAVDFSLATFEAAMSGYASGAHQAPPTEQEWCSIIPGIQRITSELSARFAADALRESYFGWDARRFPSAGAHNLRRAQGQRALADAVARRRSEAEKRLAAARTASPVTS